MCEKIATNVDGLLLCWYFIIVSLATEADCKKQITKFILLFNSVMSAGSAADQRNKVDAALCQPA